MSTDAPTRSRTSAGRRPAEPSHPLAHETLQPPTAAGPGRRTAREIALGAEVAALRAELDRRERRLRQQVECYESLLDEQARTGREADGFVWTTGRSSIEPAGGPSGPLARLRSLLTSI